MIYFKVYLDKLDWHVEGFVTVDILELNKIMRKLKELECSDKVLTKAYDIMENLYNTGFAYSNSKRHKSIMVINMSTSMEEFVNTYNHEKNHIEMHICEELRIDPFSEEAADLSGYLSQKLFHSLLSSMK